MIPNNFSKALLKSGASEAAPAAAKARAAERVLSASSVAGSAAASAAGKTAGVATTAKLSTLAFAAVLAGGLGAGSGFLLGQRTAPTKYVEVETVGASSPLVAPVEASLHPENHAVSAITASPAASAAAASAEPTIAHDVCEDATATETKSCSVNGGHTVTFALKSTCSKDTLDVFWVDTSCHEVFKGMIHPGEMFWQDSWDTHVFRVRDHATHKLVKELTPPVVDGAPDRAAYWKGTPTELPAVTIKQSDAALPETTPPECAHGGGRAARLHVKNDRTDGPITLMSVDGTCVEHELKSIAPGEKFDRSTSEGHAFRIRDVSGALLLDIPPTSLDTTTYLTVP